MYNPLDEDTAIETGLSTRDRILLASLTPSIVVLIGIVLFLLLWRKKRTSEQSDQERIIDETDGRSSPANDTLKSNKSSKHGGENFGTVHTCSQSMKIQTF